MMTVAFPDRSWIEDVGPVAGINPLVFDGSAHAALPDRLDVFIAPYVVDVEPLRRAVQVEGLRHVQLLTAGYDGALEVLPAGVTLSNAGSVHDDSTAELALALTLACQRGIPRAVRAAAEGRWDRPEMLPSLADRRVLLIGYGNVGKAIARRLLPFRVQLTAVASRARGGDDLVDGVHGIDELSGLLPQAEVVIVVVPLTEATRGLIGEDFLAALSDGSLVVNVARGPVADTEAILRHAGRLRFGLDVTDPEPLPDGHPLFAAPDVLITPHVGGDTTAFRPRAVALLRSQLALIGAGKSPAHVVN